MIKNFKNLEIRQLSRVLVKEVYVLLNSFPDEEKFVLTSQTRRASISIPSNIAEGRGRQTTKELNYFLNIAIGSTCELETQFYLAYDLGYIPKEDLDIMLKKVIQIRKMTLGYQKTFKIK